MVTKDDQLRALAIMGARSRKAILQAEMDALDVIIAELVDRGKKHITKKHWTQTPKGRALLSKKLKDFHRRKRA